MGQYTPNKSECIILMVATAACEKNVKSTGIPEIDTVLAILNKYKKTDAEHTADPEAFELAASECIKEIIDFFDGEKKNSSFSLF